MAAGAIPADRCSWNFVEIKIGDKAIKSISPFGIETFTRISTVCVLGIGQEWM